MPNRTHWPPYGDEQDTTATLHLSGRNIETETNAYVGIPWQRNVAQLLIVIVLNESGQRAPSNDWNNLIDSVAILMKNQDGTAFKIEVVMSPPTVSVHGLSLTSRYGVACSIASWRHQSAFKNIEESPWRELVRILTLHWSSPGPISFRLPTISD